METQSISNLEEPLAAESIPTPSILEQLPREIVFKIFNYTPESIGVLYLTSQQMRSIVDEYASQQPTIPLVESLHVSLMHDYLIRRDEPSNRLDICTHVHKRTHKLFQLRLKWCNPPEGWTEVEALERFAHKLFTRDTYQSPGNTIAYRVGFSIYYHEECGIKYMREVLGRQIVKLTLNDVNYLPPFDDVSRIFEGFHFNKFAMILKTMSDDIATQIPAFINKYNIDHISLSSSSNVTITDPAKFLIDLSSLVRSIYIKEGLLISTNSVEKFFGVRTVDWASIIIEMFSKKMDKLFVESSSISGHLPESGCSTLRDQLPDIDKKLWFTTTYRKSENIEHGVKDYIIKVADMDFSGRIRKAFTIKHSTRANEPF